MPDITIPNRLADYARRDPTGRQHAWIATLPARIAELSARWSLSVGEPFEPGGVAGWVAPARAPTGGVVLKLAFRHYEAEHEAEGLRVWEGRGTVRLLASAEYDDTIAMLIERCEPGTALSNEPVARQDEIVAGLLQRLWIVPPPGHNFRPLQAMCDAWADEFAEKQAAGLVAIDEGLARDALARFRELPSTAERATLLCTDLHAENVLAAERAPWLVIDPKPYFGDPTYDPVQHMLNCPERLQTNPRALATRMADLCELDRDRLASWLFARCVQQSPEWPWLEPVARALAP